MKACSNCHDTGHGNGGASPYLDCTHCEVATLRAKLNNQFPLAAKLYPDSLWGAYQAGQKPLLERIEELELEVAANREKIAAAVESDLAAHRKLAGETLRADQGWQRYEAKNRECNALREQMAADNGGGKP